MWLDREGVVHTVALPDPASVLPPGLLEDLDRERRTDEGGFLETLEEVELAIYESIDSHLSFDRRSERRYVAVALSPGIVMGSFARRSDFEALVESWPLRWRLDALSAIFDYFTE